MQIAIEDSVAQFGSESGELIGALSWSSVTLLLVSSQRGNCEIPRCTSNGFFETVQEELGVVDEHEQILICNPAFAAILGEDDPKAVIGKKIVDYMSPESQLEILAQTNIRQTGRISNEYELSVATPSGEARIVDVNVAPLLDELGKYLRRC